MTSDGDPVTELDLLAYVDGHLDPERQRVVEAHLAGHPADARRVAADIAIGQGIRRIFEGMYTDRPPSRLTARLNPRQRPIGRAIAAGLAAVVGVAGGAVGWWVGTQHQETAVAATAQPAGQIGPDQGVRRLAAHLAEGIRVPDLSAAGFRLVRQNVVGNGDRPTVQITYADSAGQRVDLFLQPRNEPVRFRYEEADKRGLLSWSDGPIVYALTGDLPADALRALGEAVHRGRAAQAAPPRAGGDKPQTPAAILPVASDDGGL